MSNRRLHLERISIKQDVKHKTNKEYERSKMKSRTTQRINERKTGPSEIFDILQFLTHDCIGVFSMKMHEKRTKSNELV